MGIAVVLSFAIPTWIEVPVFGLPMTAQTIVAILALLAFVVTSPRELLTPLTMLDFLVAGMVGIHFASDFHHGSTPLVAGLLAYGEWVLPYVAGRFAVRSENAIEPIAMCVCGVLVLLGVGGLIEMIAKINPWESLFGNRPVEGFIREASRFGFKRSFGPTTHPIYFGTLILILTPWPISFLFWARNASQRTLAVVYAVASLGIFTTLSRGPVVGWAAFYGVIPTVWVKWYRWVLGIGALVLVIGVAANFSSVSKLLDEWGGEKSRMTEYTLDGEKIEISTFRNRIVLLQVFWPAMSEAGFLGYGSKAMLTFPPDVPYLPADERARESLRYVDNAFVFYVLRFGWGGAAVFTILMLAAIFTAVYMSWDRSIGVFTGAAASMIVAMGISLLSVWFSYDFGFELLWTYGILAGLASSRC
ncbi:O-antigen ligase family protein [Planctomicrobium sp. SH668]|uniref:O-antigen ligase family protein n=1 Tax=Planctomicrobium sp. SH668 TaxID=3448126 RepID=UPI003F5C32BD